MTKERKFTILVFIVAIVLILIDQITKMTALKTLSPGEYINFIPGLVQFTYVENPGMAFGISFGAGKIILSLFSIIASAAIIWYILKIEKSKCRLVQMALGIILAGAFGNLMDRCLYGILFQDQSFLIGNVIDFILVNIPDISFIGRSYTHWPVFNIADACVTVGAIILLCSYKNIPLISKEQTRNDD